VPKISPFLWFNDKAEEAANFYVSIFKNSRITAVARYSEGAPGPKGSVMTVDFHLDGQDLVLLNGGPHYTLSPAFSFWIKCETQQEVDYYWDKLTPGGQTMQCGWLTDKLVIMHITQKREYSL
jgi:predicted 3-demethylubiquinone-9 3-methyltransferase (glyoxalase superfamily)